MQLFHSTELGGGRLPQAERSQQQHALPQAPATTPARGTALELPPPLDPTRGRWIDEEPVGYQGAS